MFIGGQNGVVLYVCMDIKPFLLNLEDGYVRPTQRGEMLPDNLFSRRNVWREQDRKVDMLPGK